jgi:hypothetical protein
MPVTAKTPIRTVHASYVTKYRLPESVHAETEGVPRRVEEHPKGRAGLVVVLGRAEVEHGRFADVEVLAVTDPDNHASQAVCRRLGMTHLGRTTRYYDTPNELFEKLPD